MRSSYTNLVRSPLILVLLILSSLAPVFALDPVPRPACPMASHCWPAPQGFVPFQSVYYITPPNAAGDRLVVGKPFSAQQLIQWIRLVPIADANTGSRFCGFVQLAPGMAVEAYLPTPSE